MKPILSIIIVTYNSGPLTLLCLWALQKSGLKHSEVLVADNASTDGIPEAIAHHFPFVRLIRNSTNQGFGRACNRAMEKASGNYFLLLNPDTIVPEDFETAIINFFKERPQAGAMGVRMVSGTGDYLPESKRNLPSPAASFYRFTGLAHLFPHSPRFARYYAGELSPDQVGTVQVLSGAFMVISRAAIEKSGPFDPRFFLYGEDIDLSWRIHEAGFEVWYNPAITILHFKGESTPQTAHQAALFYKAMQQFYRKHFSNAYPSVVSAGILAAVKGLTRLSVIGQKLKKATASSFPLQYCLSGDSSLSAIDLLQLQIPIKLLPANHCAHKKQKGFYPAVLLDTSEVNPSAIINRARQCPGNNEQLLIWHPLSEHLFKVAHKNDRTLAIRTKPD